MSQDDILMYCFGTVTMKAELQHAYKHVCILTRLHHDLKELKQTIEAVHPRFIIGLGNGPLTCYESLTQNRFHTTKCVVRGGPQTYELYIPPTQFAVSKQATDSFCNWAMYHVAQFCDDQKLSMHHMFLHVGPHAGASVLKEIDQLVSVL